MKPTTSSALSAAAEKHLGSYALAVAAGMGALTSVQVAHAKVDSFLYNNGNGTTIGTNSPFQLFTGGPTLEVGTHLYFYVGAKTSHNLAFVQQGAYATNLAKGATISAGKTFTTVTASQGGFNRQIGFDGSSINRGNFISKTGYIGFKFTDPTKSTQTDFGWVQIGENSTQSQLTILSAGYDDAGAPILAGQTTVPESTSVGLLAAGACGLGLWRRQAAQRRAARGRGGAAEATAIVA